MDSNDLKHLLTAVQTGDLSIDEGLERLRTLPFEDIGIAMIDHHRRRGTRTTANTPL